MHGRWEMGGKKKGKPGEKKSEKEKRTRRAEPEK
jgi:hypothetical protein